MIAKTLISKVIAYSTLAVGLGFAGIAITYGFLIGGQLFSQALT